LDISFIISHEELKKMKRFRIQLASAWENSNLKTPAGDRAVIYFEGGLSERAD
jgi:hypothetical protein